jgi:hypothetical protein
MALTVKTCRQAVTERRKFRVSTLYGGEHTAADGTKMYLVCSGERAYPLFVWADGIWCENKDAPNAYSRRRHVRARQQYYARPNVPAKEIVMMHWKEMQNFINAGGEHHPKMKKLLGCSVG